MTEARAGFSFIELMVAMVLIGIMVAVVVPRLRRPGPQPEDEFAKKLNLLTQGAATQAQLTGAVERIVFDFKSSTVFIEQLQPEKEGQPQKFEPVKLGYLKTQIAIPEQIEIRNFYIKGKDEMVVGGGVSTPQIWFFITPEGLAQEVVINSINSDTQAERGLVLNPFTAQFTIYDQFQRP